MYLEKFTYKLKVNQRYFTVYHSFYACLLANTVFDSNIPLNSTVRSLTLSVAYNNMFFSSSDQHYMRNNIERLC